MLVYQRVSASILFFRVRPMRSWLHVHGWSCLFIQWLILSSYESIGIIIHRVGQTWKTHKNAFEASKTIQIQNRWISTKIQPEFLDPAQIKFILLPRIGTAGELGPQGASHQGLTKLHLRNRCQPHWLFEIHQVLSHSAMRALALAYFDLLAWGAHLRFQCTKSSDNALSMRRIMNLHVLNAQMLTLVCFSFRDPLLTVGWMVA